MQKKKMETKSKQIILLKKSMKIVIELALD